MTPDRLAAFDALTPNGRALVAALRYESQVAGIADTGQYVEWLERHVLAARDQVDRLVKLLHECDTALYAHHELRQVSKFAEQGRCEVCRDSRIFERINEALEGVNRG